MDNRLIRGFRPIHFNQELVLSLVSNHLKPKINPPALGDTFNSIAGKLMYTFGQVAKTFSHQPHIKSVSKRVHEFEETLNQQIDRIGTTDYLSSPEAMASLEFIIDYLKVVQGFVRDDLERISKVLDRSHSERIYLANASVFLPAASRVFERACGRRNLIGNMHLGIVKTLDGPNLGR